jgi:integrase
VLFPTPGGGRIDINNFRHRGWTPALKAAGLKHRRIYDLRHTYATWSLAAGADAWERELLDGFDERGRSTNGRYLGAENEEEETS